MNAKIAIPFDNGNINPHFGKSTQFKIYTISEGNVTSSEIAAPEATGHDAIGLWMVMNSINAVICANIGPVSLGALAAAGIHALAGVEGSADAAIEKFISGELTATTEPTCGGHSHSGCCSSKCGGGCHGCCH